ncbi:MAG: hypothetical protein OXF39_04120 [Nitrospira sp.]|nr:hypothetical protein [Nitrospira sp.]
MQVIYGVNAAYVLPALVSIYSLWKHASQPVDITMYVDGITEQNQYAIQCVNDMCGLSIQVKDFDATGLEGYDNARFPAVSLLPLLLPSLEQGRCLFIDADTLVRGDVWELLSANLGSMPLGACTDMGQVTYLERRILNIRVSDILRPARARLKKLNYIERIAGLGFIPKENYFNSGVLVMDCDAIRGDYSDYADLASLDKLWPFRHFPDQDRLNEFFAERWCKLPLKWNVRPGLTRDVEYRKYRFRYVSDELREQMQEATIDPKIWHFMGRKKPWIKRWGTALRARQAYREYADTCLGFLYQTGLRFGI